jgi:gelsolin
MGFFSIKFDIFSLKIIILIEST